MQVYAILNCGLSHPTMRTRGAGAISCLDDEGTAGNIDDMVGHSQEKVLDVAYKCPTTGYKTPYDYIVFQNSNK